MLSRIGIIFIFFISCSIYAFSNLIVFGDSLSDSGNFPETQFAFHDLHAAKTLKNTNPHFYVPFSNPVDRHVPSQWPPIQLRYLSEQAPIFPDTKQRSFYSFSWPQFFLTLAKQNRLTRSDIIVPSLLIHERLIPANFSFNYAWGYAMSDAGCTNPHYDFIASCSPEEITQRRKQYLKTFSASDFNRLLIPNVDQQVQFFIQDVKSKRVLIDQNTLYVFYIGGNDLISGAKSLEHGNAIPAFSLILGNTADHVIAAISNLLHELPANDRPKVIYVLDQFNGKIAPAYYKRPVSRLADVIVTPFNFWLRWKAKLYNVFSKTKIVVVPVSKWYEIAEKSAYFKKTMGSACMVNGGDYANPNEIPTHNCAGFIFWNDVHPSSEMNALIADRFYRGFVLRFTEAHAEA